MVNIIVTNRSWNEGLVDKLQNLTGKKFMLITKESDLTLYNLNKIRPGYIFFPHWSYLIKEEIYKNFECIIFHMTDLPFGRGGSPLQNLIVRGIYETKMSALKCQGDLDSGPIYLKRPLSLYGTAEEIYLRANKVIEEMIVYIIGNQPQPVEQKGELVYFTRRRPEDGNIASLAELEQVFDYIRMLDAEGYPKAFLETQCFRLEFERASLKEGEIIADVRITRKREADE